MALSDTPRKTNLGADPGNFVGRLVELNALQSLFLNAGRLVTVVGPGGGGKTRLALRFAADQLDVFAEEDAGGAWFCDLTRARSADDICTAVARALDFRLEVRAQDPASRVGDELGRRGALLLVLDNFEQVIAHGAPTVGTWLAYAPEALFLVTSRERLRLTGEHVFHLEPLRVPRDGGATPETVADCEAVQLFVQRARAVRPDYVLTAAEAPVVAAIVRRLDGIPLAIELAAARMSVLDSPALLDRLQRSFEVLGRGGAGGDARHDTLDDTISWSWNLLSPVEQSTLAQLALFRGGFSLEAAEAVVAPIDTPVIDVVQSLREKSLLRNDQAAHPAGTIRLGLYEVIREYALEKLVRSDRHETTRERHARYFLSVGTEWAEGVHGPQGVGALRRLMIEIDNLAAAFEWTLARPRSPESDRDTLRAVVAMVPVFYTRGVFESHLTYLNAALARPAADARLRTRALIARSNALAGRGLWSSGLLDAQAALSIAVEIEDPSLQARSLSGMGICHMGQRNMVEASPYLEDALSIFSKIGDRRGEAFVLGLFGELHACAGKWVDAQRELEAALAILPAVGDRMTEGYYRGYLGCVFQGQGDRDRAQRSFDEALAILAEASDRRSLGWFRGLLGSLHHESGQIDSARACYEQGLTTLREVGDPEYAALFESLLGVLDADRGDVDRARVRVEAARGLLRTIESPHVATWLEINQGHLDLALACRESQRGDTAEAAEHLETARRRCTPDPKDMEARLCTRILEQTLARGIDVARAAEAPIANALLVEAHGRWFQPPGGERVDLERRPSLRRVVKALADRRLDEPGATLALPALLEAGWPGERVLPEAGSARVYVALSTLRRLGLRELLLSRDGKYLLDPDMPLRRVREET